MKVAISGANGFLGTHLVNIFLKENYKVIAIVRRNAKVSHFPKNKNLQLEYIDYTTCQTIKNNLREIKKNNGLFDYFIHSAGLTVSTKKEEYFKVNSSLTNNIVVSIQQLKLLPKNGNFIYISSFAAHGPNEFNMPISAYGESKAKAERLIYESGIKHLIIRPTAIYGEKDKAFTPLFKFASRGIYPSITRKDQKMTFVYVKDLCRAIFAEKDKDGIIFMSDHQVYTHNDLIDIFQTINQQDLLKLNVSPSLVRLGLRLSDFFSILFGVHPSMTLEKYNELSQDWNLNENISLKQGKILNPTTLENGFKKTFKYYKENHLIK